MKPDSDNLQGLPKHQQVFETLKAEIAAGHYDKSERLPSEAQLVRRFGVSRPTVSRALRDLKATGLLERRPGSGTYLSQQARAAGGYFGMIIPGHGTTEIFTPICNAIARSGQQAGYTLLWGNSSAITLAEQASQALALCQHYIRERVAGVFFEPLELVAERDETNLQIINDLASHKIPVVLIDRDIENFPDRSKFDLVAIDNLSAGHRLARHIIEQGARNITFWARNNSAPTVLQRIAGVRDAVLNAQLPWTNQQIIYGNPDDLEFVRARLLSHNSTKNPRKLCNTDAVICANDVTAARLLATMTELGIRVPHDLLLASFDDVKYASLLNPSLTTIHQPCEDIGQVALQTMLQRIAQPDAPPREILLDAKLIIRRSTSKV